MNIDDFIQEKKEYKIGQTSSKKDADDITIERGTWHHIAYHYPSLLDFIIAHSRLDDQEILFIIEILDEVIQGEVNDFKVSEDTKEELLHYREKIIEDHIKNPNSF